MGKRALRRKLQSFKLTTSQKIIGVLLTIATLVVWVAEQFAGSAVVNYFSAPVSRILTLVFEWGKEHPGQISMVIFFLTLSYLIVQIVRDTRTVKEISVTYDTTLRKDGSTLVLITNRTGDDLFDCTIDVVRVDDGDIFKPHISSQIVWFEGASEINIRNGKSWSIHPQQFLSCLVVGRAESGKPIFDTKIHYVELFFRGNTMKSETPSMRIWIPATVKNVEVGESGQFIDRVIWAGEIETAHPEFG